jgi:hypothetical protein
MWLWSFIMKRFLTRERFIIKVQERMERAMEQVYKDHYFAFCKHLLIYDPALGLDFLKGIWLIMKWTSSSICSWRRYKCWLIHVCLWTRSLLGSSNGMNPMSWKRQKSSLGKAFQIFKLINDSKRWHFGTRFGKHFYQNFLSWLSIRAYNVFCKFWKLCLVVRSWSLGPICIIVSNLGLTIRDLLEVTPSRPTFKSGGKLFKRLASFENSSLEMEFVKATN